MAQYQVEVGRRVAQFDGQSLTTTLWAMAALSATHCEGFVRLVERFVALERHGSFQACGGRVPRQCWGRAGCVVGAEPAAVARGARGCL